MFTILFIRCHACQVWGYAVIHEHRMSNCTIPTQILTNFKALTFKDVQGPWEQSKIKRFRQHFGGAEHDISIFLDSVKNVSRGIFDSALTMHYLN